MRRRFRCDYPMTYKQAVPHPIGDGGGGRGASTRDDLYFLLTSVSYRMLDKSGLAVRNKFTLDIHPLEKFPWISTSLCCEIFRQTVLTEMSSLARFVSFPEKSSKFRRNLNNIGRDLQPHLRLSCKPRMPPGRHSSFALRYTLLPRFSSHECTVMKTYCECDC